MSEDRRSIGKSVDFHRRWMEISNTPLTVSDAGVQPLVAPHRQMQKMEKQKPPESPKYHKNTKISKLGMDLSAFPNKVAMIAAKFERFDDRNSVYSEDSK